MIRCYLGPSMFSWYKYCDSECWVQA